MTIMLIRDEEAKKAIRTQNEQFQHILNEKRVCLRK